MTALELTDSWVSLVCNALTCLQSPPSKNNRHCSQSFSFPPYVTLSFLLGAKNPTSSNLDSGIPFTALSQLLPLPLLHTPNFSSFDLFNKRGGCFVVPPCFCVPSSILPLPPREIVLCVLEKREAKRQLCIGSMQQKTRSNAPLFLYRR